MAWMGASLTVLVGVCASLVMTAARAAPPASPYAGQWQVRQVLVHEDRADRLLYQVNDPRLVGRMVDIDVRRIDSDLPEASHCDQPVLVPRPQVLNTLLTRTLWSALPGKDAAQAFGLQVSGTREVKVAWTACTVGQFGPSLKTAPTDKAAGDPERTWVALATPNQLLMPWYGDTLLVLEPRASDQPARPSFACGQARLPAEKAICASPRLSSYDLSLSQAWRAAVQASEGDAGCLTDARRDQTQWVATRNQCARDEDCLRQAMKTRLDALMTPAQE